MLFAAQTCVAGAYVSPATGAKATVYGGADPCSPSATIVSEETFTIGSCAIGGYGAFSEMVTCTPDGVVVSAYLGPTCDTTYGPAVYTSTDPIGCVNGVLTVCAATPSPSPTPVPTSAPGYLATVSV